MAVLDAYTTPGALPGTVSGRVSKLLGLTVSKAPDDVFLADQISKGLKAASADALSAILGRSSVVGPLIPEATLRRAKKEAKPLSREMSERLYEVSRVVDAVAGCIMETKRRSPVSQSAPSALGRENAF